MKHISQSQLRTCVIKYRTEFCADVHASITNITDIILDGEGVFFQRNEEDADVDRVLEALSEYYEIDVTDLSYDSSIDKVLIFYKENADTEKQG